MCIRDRYALLDISEEFGMGNSGMGVIATARAIGMVVMPILVAYIADKMPKKAFAQLSGWVYIAFSLIMGIWGTNFYVVLISVFFIYACSTTLYAALIVLLAETDPRSTNRFSNIISLVNLSLIHISIL